MSKMAETNKLLKMAVKNTCKKLTSIPKQHPKKTFKYPKPLRKWTRQLNLQTRQIKTAQALKDP